MRTNKEIAEFNKRLGCIIHELRTSHGLSREALAKKIGVTHQQVQKYEKGDNRICLYRLIRIVNAFSLSSEEFFSKLLDENLDPDKAKSTRADLEIIKSLQKIPHELKSNINDIVIKIASCYK